MVGSTPPEMTRAGQGRARTGRGAWRRWRAVLCVALLAPLLPAAAGPVAAQSGGDVPGVGFVGTDDHPFAEMDSPGCYFGSIDPHDEMVPADKNRTKKRIHVIDGSYEQNPGLYNDPDRRPPSTRVPFADIDRVKVDLDADTVYVFEVRGKDTGGGSLVDPELSGVYVEPGTDVYEAYEDYIDENTYALYEHDGELRKFRLDADGKVVIPSDVTPGNYPADDGETRIPGRYNPPNRLDSDSGQIFGNGIEDEDRAGTPRVPADEPRVHEYVLFDEDGDLIPVLFDGNPMPWLNDDGNVLDYGGDPVFVDEGGNLVYFNENGDPVDKNGDPVEDVLSCFS